MTKMINVQNLRYTYPQGQTEALKGIDFVIEQGEIVGFLGPSGAGKSTTQKILIGLLKGHSGTAEVFGRDIASWDRSYYEKIGVGFELPNHYLKLTARENLTHFRNLYSGPTRDPDELLELVGLSDAADQRVEQFSKGMKMRLNFVRAIIHNPDLIFFDEPTTGLDPVNGRKIKDIILRLRDEGKTIFLTTHNMGVADELCDRVAFIVEGQLAVTDSPRNLKIQYGERKVTVAYGENGTAVSQEFPLDNLNQNPAFLSLLARPDLQTIHTQEATLENIFIEVTGVALA